ncbi:D-arabinono-1,4-lactone oxidase [Microbacterium azadirachtae]|uniref:Putative xylitol oxidase n=1 Tax=Microbacterium azadirachtae TaxID=582680 RepID=A0A0F0LKS5_9MICO|nr:D-arabinono-1,4-lactone oxidase [Microbacterium azadirachtae]KJL33812.1 putative xylitol oxidase [Microbacterium azadirachtae]
MTIGTNWAGNLHYAAAGIAHPRSREELHDVLSSPGGLRPLGSRHSFNTIADTTGTLVDLSAMPAVIEQAAPDAVRVSGGMRYGELGAELHRRGLALANLASLPHISVAGAVSTGTHGSGDRIGSLAAAVRAVTIAGPDGERAFRRGDADFAGAIVSLGALGVMVELELDVEPTYEVAQTVHEGPRWDDVLAEFDRVTALGTSVSVFSRWVDRERADQLWVKNRVGGSALDQALLDRLGATPATVQRHPILGAPAEACTPQLGESGPWHERLPHFRLDFTPSAGEELQSEYLVPRRDAVRALEAIRELADRIAPLLLVNEVRTVAADDLWLSPSYGEGAVALHFTWRRDQPAVEALLPEIEAALPDTARPHWGKLSRLDPGEIRRRFPRWSDFAALAARMDPAARFRNAYLERLGL